MIIKSLIYSDALNESNHIDNLPDFAMQEFKSDLMRGDINGFMYRLKAFICEIPFSLHICNEHYYHSIIHCVFRLMGLSAIAEKEAAFGKSDLEVHTNATIYIFEFKWERSPREALLQIESKGYALPYRAGRKKIVGVGVELTQRARGIWRWETKEFLEPLQQ